jgi:hypothetical protein
LESIRKRRKYGRVWTMDEAGIYNDATVQRSYSLIGSTPQIGTPNSHGRDTIIAAVSENGEKIPLYFVPHRRKKYLTRVHPYTKERFRVLADRGISGLTNEIMAKWIDHFLSQPQLHPNEDILLFDQHRSHLNEKNMKKLLDVGLEILPFPKGTAPELSQCDNSLFRDFKRDFAAAWNEKSYNKEIKQQVIFEVWEKFSEERIRNYWRKCGHPIKPTRRRLLNSNGSRKISCKKQRTVAHTARIESFFE